MEVLLFLHATMLAIIASVFIHSCYCLEFGKDVPILSRQTRSFLFTESSSMGLYLAVAVPLDLINKDVAVSWNFEANYNLPYNATELSYYSYARRESRSLRNISRASTYEVLESKFESHGLDGFNCLLRTICEAAEVPMRGTSMIGDILHIILTPSSSRDEGLDPEYSLAEIRGQQGEDCRMHYEDCPLGLLELISELDD